MGKNTSVIVAVAGQDGADSSGYDADLTINVDATGESSVCTWFIDTQSDTQAQRRPVPYLWIMVSVSINDVNQGQIVGRESGSYPCCVRKFRCTWVSDFVFMNQATH
ncbi:hypothetical protein AVEN_135722-1 [Araneus ventricosus]|uniref:Uncharacterized protein n=1 Tax=Araneus ventricosus TaxID=182803 RepID=A0A4Y2U6R0_ARAVE|nr:hypothetical protein AVEN_135722-1 [Araneus ventricosus]